MAWLRHSFAIVVVWIRHGFCMAEAWLCHGLGMVFAMVLPWVRHCFGILHFPHIPTDSYIGRLLYRFCNGLGPDRGTLLTGGCFNHVDPLVGHCLARAKTSYFY